MRVRAQVGSRWKHRNRFIRRRKIGGFQFGVKRNISRRPRQRISWGRSQRKRARFGIR